MTSKEKVLNVYPDAFWLSDGDGVFVPGGKYGNKKIGHGNHDAAWDDAANQLPSAPSPAEETASPEKRVVQPIPCPTCNAPIFTRANKTIVAHFNGDGDRCKASETVIGCDCAEYVNQVCDICQGVSVPEPVSLEVIHVPRIPGTVNTRVGPMIPAPEAAAAGEEYTVDTHKLGTCLRFANGETCIGCGDKKNGEPLPVAAPIAPAAEDEIDALINEVAPPPLVVSETAVHQLRPLLLELIARRKAEELIQELVNALKGVIPYMEQVETAGLVGHEGCHWPVEFVRAALTRAEEYRKGANNG